jgi:hypothetical protein
MKNEFHDVSTLEAAKQTVRKIMVKHEADKILDDDVIEMTASLVHKLWQEGHFRK